MSRCTHAFEDADITARDVRHAQAKHRRESIRTHQGGIPCMGCTPVVTHDYGAGNIQRIEESDEVSRRLERRIQG